MKINDRNIGIEILMLDCFWFEYFGDVEYEVFVWGEVVDDEIERFDYLIF